SRESAGVECACNSNGDGGTAWQCVGAERTLAGLTPAPGLLPPTVATPSHGRTKKPTPGPRRATSRSACASGTTDDGALAANVTRSQAERALGPQAVTDAIRSAGSLAPRCYSSRRWHHALARTSPVSTRRERTRRGSAPASPSSNVVRAAP